MEALKLRLISWLFKEERAAIFRLAHKDIMETMKDDLDKRAEALSHAKLEALLTNIHEEDVIATKGNVLYLGGKPVDPQRLANLKAEAEFFTNSDLWKVLNETPKELAHRAMFVEDGKLENQLLKGRAILFMLGTQNKVIKTISDLSPTGQS